MNKMNIVVAQLVLLSLITSAVGLGTCSFYDESGNVTYPEYPEFVAYCASLMDDPAASEEEMANCCTCLKPFPSFNGILYCINQDEPEPPQTAC